MGEKKRRSVFDGREQGNASAEPSDLLASLHVLRSLQLQQPKQLHAGIGNFNFICSSMLSVSFFRHGEQPSLQFSLPMLEVCTAFCTYCVQYVVPT